MAHDDLREAAARFVEELAASKEFIADHRAAQAATLVQVLTLAGLGPATLSEAGKQHSALRI